MQIIGYILLAIILAGVLLFLAAYGIEWLFAKMRAEVRKYMEMSNE